MKEIRQSLYPTAGSITIDFKSKSIDLLTIEIKKKTLQLFKKLFPNDTVINNDEIFWTLTVKYVIISFSSINQTINKNNLPKMGQDREAKKKQLLLFFQKIIATNDTI